MSKTVTIYTQPACGPCTAVKRWLDKKGIEYTAVNVRESPEDANAIRALGYPGTPVVIVSGGDAETDIHWHGFVPDNLERYCGKDAA